MNDAFGEIRTIPATNSAKSKMKKLVTLGQFKEQRDVWRLGAALGIAKGMEEESGKRETFQNINSLDPDGFFSSIMFGLYPDMEPEDRVKKIVNHAEWGINEIYHQNDIGTLNFADFAKIGDV